MTKLLLPTIFGLMAIASLMFVPVTEVFAQATPSFNTIILTGEGRINCPDGSNHNNVLFSMYGTVNGNNIDVFIGFQYADEFAAISDDNAAIDVTNEGISIHSTTAAAATSGCFENSGGDIFTTIAFENCGTKSKGTFENSFMVDGNFKAQVFCA